VTALTDFAQDDLNVRTGRLSGVAISLIVGNLGALYYSFIWDFSLYQVVVMFMTECVWIGAFSALRLIVASLFSRPYDTKNVGVSPGISLLISGFLIWTLGARFFALIGAILVSLVFVGWKFGDLSGVGMFVEIAGAAILASFPLLIGHTAWFFWDFLIQGEYRTARPGELLERPFVGCRGLLAAIAVALGATVLLPGLATTSAFAILVILGKAALDVRVYLRERTRSHQGQAGSGRTSNGSNTISPGPSTG
jgi:hypothetical protein